MQSCQYNLIKGSLSTFSSTSSLSSSSEIDSVSSTSTIDLTLNQVLSNPKLLCSFEGYLRQTLSHENLLFIEAISHLKHEKDPKDVENTLYRIYKTFLATGSPLELNVTTANKVKEDMKAVEWVILQSSDAITILEETEAQVIDILKAKLSEFIETMHISTGNFQPATIQSQQVRVVIIGGGFTGFTVASILDQMPRFYVTLIDTKDSFEYTPGIVKKLISPEKSSSLRVRHDAYVKNGRVIIGFAENLANQGKTIAVNGEVINLDYLVVATGSSYSSQLKSTDTSSLYRTSGLEESYLELLKAKKILIIGGGLVGCELASEISQYTFPGPYPNKKVTLVDAHPNLVYRSDPKQQSIALKYLQELDVEVICNERILDFDSTNENIFHGTSGRIYSGYDKVFIATGTRPNNRIITSSSNDATLDNSVDDWGRIKVRPTLQIEHYKYDHIFAGGDVTNVLEEKTGYAATISGVCIARNICRLVKGKTPLKQGTKGTLPAPNKPLHGIWEHGGIGKQNLNIIKKKFSFLNPSWAALKYFDEQQFLRIVQGQASINSSHVLGKLPRKLSLPTISTNHNLSVSQINDKLHVLGSLNSSPLAKLPKTQSLTNRNSNSKNKHEQTPFIHHEKLQIPYDGQYRKTNNNNAHKIHVINDDHGFNPLLFECFTYGGEDIQLFVTSQNVTSKEADSEVSHDKNFQLSPPPRSHKRNQHLLLNNYNIQSVKLTRSESFTSIIQNI